jgi:putative Holliday junction resolvase
MRVLGIDYGQRRIGLALSDATGMLARPWKIVPRSGNPVQVAAALRTEIESLAAEDDGLAGVVLGFPRRLSGEENEQSHAVRAVAARLREVTAIPVYLQDERLTSREAEALLARREKDWRKRKASIDAVAAAVILQDYLDSTHIPSREAAPRNPGSGESA